MHIFSDDDIIIVNKRCGQAVQPGPGVTDSLIESLEKDFGKLYLVHRLDTPVSGIIVFARSKKSAASLSRQFSNAEVKKKYVCAVDNPPPVENGTLENLIHIPSGKKANKVYIRTEDGRNTKKAVLDYRTIFRTDRYYILEIILHTGRRHQIRAQLSNIGCHIKGDVKYGARRTNRAGGIHLHALSLSFVHPRTGTQLEFSAPLPDEPLWNAVCEGVDLPPSS
ncbi:MAG: RNA pseudouridine synthase [Spirochaetales bacterium]|uniref:RNA pseudouridine synthase n=1 Tax=Candidatus Thalassospirochaeta sargassi TaxID=3119039 RepID=A0AAJ1IDT0_9SPIO|nr:RNA pseudouridine synthase [Spirochaetales bacterium]